MNVDLNVDMGESFGMYRMGDDAGFMPFITSANVACGFHAGDPCVMKQTVSLAHQHQVQVGAHPGLPDLQGFGRRIMDVTMDELYCDLVYQIGALKGFLQTFKLELHHVKPHGKLYGMAHLREEVARTVCRVMNDIAPGAYLYCMKKGLLSEIAQSCGIRPIHEVYADLDYDEAGNLVITRHHATHAPADVAAKVIRMIRDGMVTTTAGNDIAIEGTSVCVHSDSAGASEIVQAVRSILLENDYTIAAPPLS